MEHTKRTRGRAASHPSALPAQQHHHGVGSEILPTALDRLFDQVRLLRIEYNLGTVRNLKAEMELRLARLMELESFRLKVLELAREVAVEDTGSQGFRAVKWQLQHLETEADRVILREYQRISKVQETMDALVASSR